MPAGPTGPRGEQAPRLVVDPSTLTFARKTPCVARSMNDEFYVVTETAATQQNCALTPPLPSKFSHQGRSPSD